MNRCTSFGKVAVLVACIGGSAPACYVEAETAPVVVDDYEPVYYDGYVVYYDAVGRPFYYVNGGIVWIGPEYAGYGGLVRHWRFHAPAYQHWYVQHGYRYRTYRRR